MLLTNLTAGEDAIGGVTTTGIESHGAPPPLRKSITTCCPTAPVTVVGCTTAAMSGAAQALGLAFHELATNAVKYGALSIAEGRVEITWAIDHNADAGKYLTLNWVEKDGPVVVPPSRRGFGSEVIAQMAPVSLSGRVVLDFASTGLRCTLAIPITSLSSDFDDTAAQQSGIRSSPLDQANRMSK